MHVSRVTHKGRGDSPQLVERKGKIKGGHFWHKGRGQEDIILCKYSHKIPKHYNTNSIVDPARHCFVLNHGILFQ